MGEPALPLAHPFPLPSLALIYSPGSGLHPEFHGQLALGLFCFFSLLSLSLFTSYSVNDVQAPIIVRKENKYHKRGEA